MWPCTEVCQSQCCFFSPIDGSMDREYVTVQAEYTRRRPDGNMQRSRSGWRSWSCEEQVHILQAVSHPRSWCGFSVQHRQGRGEAKIEEQNSRGWEILYIYVHFFMMHHHVTSYPHPLWRKSPDFLSQPNIALFHTPIQAEIECLEPRLSIMMMMMMMMMKHLESTSKVQSSWRRLGDEMRCWKEGFHGYDNRDIFPLDIDGYFYDSFSYDLTDILSWLTHLILVQWLNSFITLVPHISYHSHDESNVLPYCHPFLLLWLLFLCCIIIFPMAVLLCLLRLHIMTHFWLISDSHYSPCL